MALSAREFTIDPDQTPQDVSARWRRSGKALLAVAAIASIFQAALIAQRMHNPHVLLSVGMLAVLFVPMLYGLVLLHEAGHALVARVMGFKVVVVQVGRFGVLRDARGTRLIRHRVTKGPAGVCIAVPCGTRALVLRFALVVAAGPLVNFVIAFLLLRGWKNYLPAHVFSPTTPVPVLTLADITIASLIMGAASLLPIRSKDYPSDGVRLRLLLRGGGVARRHVAVSTLSALVFIGARYRDLPSERLEAALVTPDGTADSIRAHLHAYYWALDHGNPKLALTLLTKASSVSTDAKSAARATITLELAYILSWYVPRPDHARKLWNTAARNLCPPASRFRTAAAINLVEGNLAAAVEQAERLIAYCGPHSWRGTFQAEIEWGQNILEQAHARLAADPAGEKS